MEAVLQKKSLRRDAIASRQAIPPDIWQRHSQSICQHLAQWQIFQQAQVVLAYQSFCQEPDLSDLWQKFPDKIWGFPRCVGKDLVWHQVNIFELQASHEACMDIGSLGIKEPCPQLPEIDLEQVDMIFVPAVACDRTGYRLGYGGGFYDRWLSDQTGDKVGIIFADYFLAQLPHEDWDVPMQAICTELGIFEVI
ncbi:5-formyltetrahydrofolate cyclo-ligase [Tumidithrix elongata RA019]|uniref:5-formyltetrahydrofolate cyclo-ligase n=1 Tax=Tumidithrix elongata BACA0141 TaxID=2716417 RepID=A0AAW9Q519_9CYAN|nr:5-formyltetrahydrofolate cyclo-ligase [Tumidithrix elongata RA019]